VAWSREIVEADRMKDRVVDEVVVVADLKNPVVRRELNAAVLVDTAKRVNRVMASFIVV
jgi:hypothetical protein